MYVLGSKECFRTTRKYQNTDKIFLEFLKPDFVRNKIKDDVADKKKLLENIL